MSALDAAQPFRLAPGAGAATPLLIRPVYAALERLLGLSALNAVYARTQRRPTSESFLDAALRELSVRLSIGDDGLARIPARGALVLVANHPFGGLDGIALAAAAARVRPDFKLLANYVLCRIPELRPILIPVDPFGGRGAAARNVVAMRAAIRWVRDGGALGVFPAGEVAHRTLAQPRIADPPWSDAVARLILHTRAAVAPVHFAGRNSELFQLAGLLHPRVRTAMLARELLNKRRRVVHLRVGRPIGFERLRQLGDPARITEYLRLRTAILASRDDLAEPPAVAGSNGARIAALPPLAPAERPGSIRDEIAALPEDQRLAAVGNLAVLVARAPQIPRTLREIGRRREETFRAVGEGSGKPLDLDRFDESYLHLFLWDGERERIAGGYRIGPTDEVLARCGVNGLYTSTLFRFDPRLLPQLGPALELGRSFVAAEYQRDFAPLTLLWKGIGRFVASRPRYRCLFGPVSISDEFHSLSKQLLVEFLRRHDFHEQFAPLVASRNPPRFRAWRDESRRLARAARSIEEVDELVAEIEADGRKTPVLLRQYLRLGAKLLAFNVDPDFGHVLDGLVLVDLAQTPRAILDRYLGRDAAAGFLAVHRPEA